MRFVRISIRDAMSRKFTDARVYTSIWIPGITGMGNQTCTRTVYHTVFIHRHPSWSIYTGSLYYSVFGISFSDSATSFYIPRFCPVL